jgi:hypothetical protein
MTDDAYDSGWGGDYDSAPLGVIVADSAEGLARATAAISAVGGRVGRQAGLGDGRAVVLGQVRADAILVDLSVDHGVQGDALLHAAVARASADRIPCLITVAPDLIDIAAQHCDMPGVSLLAEPSDAECAAALALALGRQRLLVADVAAELDAMRLQRLADEVSRIAKALSSLSVPEMKTNRTGLSDAMLDFRAEPALSSPEPEPSEIRATIRLRRLRERFFDPELFADPAWDMLLDLAAARLEQVQVAVSSLCIAASVPPTTALRWIKAMSDQGLFVRCADPDDGRRIFIRLSDGAASGVFRYFTAMKKMGGVAV